MSAVQLILDAGEVIVAARCADRAVDRAIDATPDELRRAAGLIRDGAYRAVTVVRRLEALAAAEERT